MNDQLRAMLDLAAMRDAMVVKLFLTAAGVLMSYGLLHAARFPVGIREKLIRLQLGVLLMAWGAMLITLWMKGAA